MQMQMLQKAERKLAGISCLLGMMEKERSALSGARCEQSKQKERKGKETRGELQETTLEPISAKFERSHRSNEHWTANAYRLLLLRVQLDAWRGLHFPRGVGLRLEGSERPSGNNSGDYTTLHLVRCVRQDNLRVAEQ